MLMLVNNRRLMRQYINNKIQNVLAWGTAIILILLTATLLVTSLFPNLPS